MNWLVSHATSEVGFWVLFGVTQFFLSKFGLDVRCETELGFWETIFSVCWTRDVSRLMSSRPMHDLKWDGLSILFGGRDAGLGLLPVELLFGRSQNTGFGLYFCPNQSLSARKLVSAIPIRKIKFLIGRGLFHHCIHVRRASNTWPGRRELT